MTKEQRQERARTFFLQGYNCCQSVAMCYADVLGMEEKDIARLGSGFGGGFGRMREVCGCVSGMTLVAGAAKPADNPDDKSARTENYALVQKLAGKFREAQGSVICRELLKLRAKGPESPAPSDRTPQYYSTRPCADLVACAAGILADELGF